MITNVLKKSTPLNLFLIIILMLVFFFIALFQDATWTNSPVLIFEKIGLFIFLMGTIFMTNFVTKRNELSKDSSFIIFFCFLFLLFFPSALHNFNLIVSNFFILLAVRRAISLQSLLNTKEKIFDASLYVFLASLFHFWCIIFLLLVFISILLHAANDYRNWITPFIAFVAVGVISSSISLIFKVDLYTYFYNNACYDFSINYFSNIYQNIAFSLFTTFALFFIISLLIFLPNRPTLLKAPLKKIGLAFFVGMLIFIISPHKSNDLLIYTVVPLAIIATSHIEMKQTKLKQEMVLIILILTSIFTFFSQV